MIKQIELIIPPEELHNKDYYKSFAANKLGKNILEINAVNPVRRSIDARSKNPVYKVLADVFINESPDIQSTIINYQPVTFKKESINCGLRAGRNVCCIKIN